MYLNHVAFEPTLLRMEGNFVTMGGGKDFGWVRQTAFKTTCCGKVGIQFPCGTKGVLHGEPCTWFEGAWNLFVRSTYDKKQPTPPDNGKVLLQR
jgi:hypothetical protein